MSNYTLRLDSKRWRYNYATSLAGSAARDAEYLQMTLKAAQEREVILKKLVNDTEAVKDADIGPIDINVRHNSAEF